MLRSILTPLKNVYDYIILDCPPSLGTITINALIAAESLLIPVQSEYFSLNSLGKLHKVMQNILQVNIILRILCLMQKSREILKLQKPRQLENR